MPRGRPRPALRAPGEPSDPSGAPAWSTVERRTLPGTWHPGGGEAGGRWEEGVGYYSHWYYPADDRRFELQVDTFQMMGGDLAHCVELREVERDERGDVVDDRPARHAEVRALDPDRPASQRWAARQAHRIAAEFMTEHSRGEVDVHFRGRRRKRRADD